MKNIILIDYENLQVKNLDDVYCLDADVYVFRGPTQNKLPAELIESAQKFGSRITWIKASRQGHNALDFHIAYFVGQIVQSDPKVFFHIVSKDDGFDALIDFMKERKLFIDRVESIEEIPLVKKMKAIESNPVAFIKDRILNVSSGDADNNLDRWQRKISLNFLSTSTCGISIPSTRLKSRVNTTR